MKLEKQIVHALTRQEKTVSIAESCTGGWVTKQLTSVSGASKVFELGVIAYSARTKQRVLKISSSLLKKYGEVSEPVALAMAHGVQKLSHSDYAISVTGIAGPTGGTAKKPVGTVCLSLISKDGRHIKLETLQFKGDRNSIRKNAATQILKWLYICLTNKQ